MSRPRLLVVACIALSTLAPVASRADGVAYLGQARGTAGYVALSPSGWLSFNYQTGVYGDGHIQGDEPGTNGPTERTFANVSACYAAGCISGSQLVEGTPAHPEDPLLTGGVRLFQVAIEDGPIGCEGSLITVAFNSAASGPFGNRGDHFETLDPQRVDVGASSDQTREVRLIGSISSCLGGASISSVDDAALAYRATYLGAAAY